MKTLLLVATLSLLTLIAVAQETQSQQMVVLDEDVWVTFYDLPSRRFRSIRDAFVRRDFQAVSRDLDTTISFFSIEADRAAPELKPALTELLERMQFVRGNLSDTSLNVSQLDAMFARAHWLLSQQYLVHAIQAKNSGSHKTAGRYLFATAHHLERAVLWSNERVSRDVVKSLDSIRDLAGRLQSSDTPERIFKDKPIVLTSKTLIKVGQQIDRRVRIAELMPK